MSLIFHIGVLRQSNEQTEAALRREHEEHRDILQNSLVDNYQNLTRNISLQADHKQSFLPLVKSAFMLSWAQGLTRDQNVTHIVKGQLSSFYCPQVLTR